jgi:hypothetical protein
MGRKGRGRKPDGKSWKKEIPGRREMVMEIRTKFIAGAKQADLAREYGLEKSVVNHIVLKRTWRDLP